MTDKPRNTESLDSVTGSHGAQHWESGGDHGSTHEQMPGAGLEAEHTKTGAGDHGQQDDHAHHVDHQGHEEVFRRRFWVCLALSVPVLIYSPSIQEWLGYTAPAFPGSEWITPVLSVIIFIYGGLPFLSMARVELANREPGMMTLISLAISVAFVYSMAAVIFSLGESFFWELVTLIDVMLLGHWLEMRSVRQASGALSELASLMPDIAERLDEEGEPHEVEAAELRQGDRVLIRPGAAIPADGEVFEGQSALDESMITGESKLVDKVPGDSVIAGTTNSGDGSLRVTVTAVGEETALSGILRLVAEAQASKSETQLLADRAAGWLFWIALAAAFLTAIAWTIAVGVNSDVLLRVVTVLVIACPHALGLAIPLVVAITTSKAASSGMLVRDRRAMESARDVDVVMFDKTGTLTRGEQGVVGLTAPGMEESEALRLAAAVESDSEHAIARAIRDRAAEVAPDQPLKAHDFEAMKGRGVAATVEGERLFVGGPTMLTEQAISVPSALEEFAAGAAASGHSVIYLARQGQALAAFALADVVREASRQAVEELQDMGIEVAMITGDSEAVARTVASQLGIDRYFAQVLPEDKDKEVQKVQSEGKFVIMVGDGVNDAPALARADVGVAIGSGTNVAVESAGVVLVQNNPLDVVHLVRLSEASYRKMRQNIWWAAGYNIIAIPLAAGVLAPWGILLPPALGAAVMSLSTIIVAVNAQLLRRADLNGHSEP